MVFILLQRVADMIVRMRKETSGLDDQMKSQIRRLILIDRTVDLVTPVLSQLTYEGLIDEHIGLKCSKYLLSIKSYFFYLLIEVLIALS